MYLYKNNISGDLPQCMGKLHKLRLIDLSSNLLSGTIPHSFFNKNMSSLERLHMANMELTGEIPSITHLDKLSSLVLDRNDLNGTIPTDIGKLTNLSECCITVLEIIFVL